MIAAVALCVLSGGLVSGYISDLVMGHRGFGFFGNGFLAILGGGTGAYTRYALFGWLQGREILITEAFAVSTATLILVLFGLGKRWVQG